MNRYNFDKEEKFKEENDFTPNNNNNPNSTEYIEEEEEYFEENHFINYIIKGIILVLLLEIFLLGIGVFTTKEVNNVPQVVTIEDRKENIYIEKVNNTLEQIQQDSLNIHQIFELFYQNQNRGTREADREIKGYMLTNQKFIEDFKYMTPKTVPQRFRNAHEAFKQMLNTRLKTTQSLLNYLRTFSPKYIEDYNQNRQQYHREINGFSNLWNRLISN